MRLRPFTGRAHCRKGCELDTERIAIAGGPKTGKTTLADLLAGTGGEAKHTDDLMSLGWSESSEAVSKWFDDPECQVMEGVSIVRALRKWLKSNPDGKPVDRVIYLSEPFEALSERQEAMAKGCGTIWSEIELQLAEREVVIGIPPKVSQNLPIRGEKRRGEEKRRE